MWRRLDLYEAGALVQDVEVQEKKYKSHRRKILREEAEREVAEGLGER